MADYVKGELITVTIKNFKIVEDYSLRGVHDGIEYSTRRDRGMDEIYISRYSSDISVEKSVSKNAFKPVVGDIYRADGKIWYVRAYDGFGPGTVVIEDGEGHSYSDDRYNLTNEITQFQNKMPKLIVRNGKTVD